MELTAEQHTWVENIFASLTVDEKIGQLICEHINKIPAQMKVCDFIAKYPVGSIYVNPQTLEPGEDPKDVIKELDASTRGKTKVPLCLSGDYYGYTSPLDLGMALGATFSPELGAEAGHILGKEGSRLNFKWVYGPIVDLNTNRENPVTNFRCQGDDPDNVISIHKEVVREMQAHGVAACIKHFPGDGTDTRNQHLVTAFNTLSMAEWYRLHGRVFKELIDAGAWSVMAGHLAFPAYEPLDQSKQRYRPATVSSKIIKELLRSELGFKGLVLSDALTMQGFRAWGDYEERIIDCVNAGVNMLLWPETEQFYELMHRALADGRVSMAQIDESARYVLEFKARLGYHKELPSVQYLTESEVDEHKDFLRRASEQSINLLRNKRNLIPLKLSPKSRILIIQYPDFPTAVKKIGYFENRLGERGFEVDRIPYTQFKDYRSKLERYDMVIILCNAKPLYLTHRWATYELWQIMSYTDPAKRIAISFGTPYFLYDIDSIDTYINAYCDEEPSQEAAIRAIFGEIPFLGRAPVSVPNCFSLRDGQQIDHDHHNQCK